MVHVEKSEDSTLMGRLATRMVARDFIDKQNLGLGTKAQKAAVASASKAPMAKVETSKELTPEKNAIIENNVRNFGSKKEKQMLGMADSAPSKMNISGVAKGMKHEMEHKKTINKAVKDASNMAKGKGAGTDSEKVAEDIAKDHLKEDPSYYEKLKKAGL